MNFAEIRKALGQVLYGMALHDMARNALRTRGSMEHLFILMSFGDLLGVPVLPPYYSLRLLPFVVGDITNWKRRMLRERDVVDMIGQMDYPVIIVDHDPCWAQRFAREKAEILRVLNGLEVTVEHVGSTSVPGLSAKPIIDIMVEVACAKDAALAVGPLTSLGYEYEGEMGIPGRFYFNKGIPRTFHLHLYPRGHSEIERHLLFRDYLRRHPEAAQEYDRLKRSLAKKYKNDRAAYTESKTEFVRATEEKARNENVSSSQIPTLG